MPSNIVNIEARNNDLTSLSILDRSNLKSLSLIENYALTTLQLGRDYALTTLELEGCTALKNLTMQTLSSFNFSSFKVPSSVKYFDCGFNNLTALPSLQASLETLECNNNKFTSLDVSYRGLNTLNVSNNPLMTKLDARNNRLTSVNVTGCSSLKELYLQKNMTLSSLDVSDCPALHELWIHNNQFKGNAMTALINGLRNIPTSESEGVLVVFFNDYATPDDNEITGEQVAAAHAKRWIPKRHAENGWNDVPETITGDLDGNGLVDVEDVNAAINIILKLKTVADYPGNGDMDGNGIIDVEDVNAMINIILKL